MEEIWKDIPEYEGFYQVSNLGRIRRNNNILKVRDNGYGYLTVNLCKNNKIKRKYIHRLVALAFLPNKDNLPQVNHKNENKQDNRVENLEWCTPKYNANYGDRNKKCTIAKRILQGKLVARYDSKDNIIDKMYMSEAINFKGVHYANLRKCCLGLQKTAGGYKWRYIDE